MSERIGARPRSLAFAARAAWVPLSVLCAGALAWLLTTALPGDAASRILGANATPERLADLRARLGLDQSLAAQFGEWIAGLFSGNLGVSALTGEPVTGLVLARLGNSAVLAALAAVVALGGGIALGTFIGLRRRGRAASTGLLVAGSAIPDFVFGALAVGVLAVSLRVLPALSMIPTGANPLMQPEKLVIPVLALALPVLLWVARYVTASVARETAAEHVVAAELAGLSRARVVTRHLLPAALAPLVQLFGWMAAVLAGSTVIVEQLVEYPGIGSLLVEALGNRDIPVVTAIVTVLAAVVAIVVWLSELLATRIDPRITNA